MGIEIFGGGGSGGGGGIADKTIIQLAPIPISEIQNGDYVGFRVHVPQNRTLNLFAFGIQNSNNASEAGLKAQVIDETNNSTIYSTEDKRVTAAPLASKDGEFDALFRIKNDTGSPADASATFAYTVE